MIKINLLPHRAIKRATRRRDFFVAAGLSLGASVLIVVLVGIVISSYIAIQNTQNQMIKAENAKLDVQIKEIASLRQEIDALKARQQAVENLQSDRNLPVHLLDELVKHVPEGVYLRAVKQENLKVSLSGLAQSNERVSELLRNLGNASEWLEKPELVEIKSITINNRRLFEFSVNVYAKRPSEKDAKQISPARGVAPAVAETKK